MDTNRIDSRPSGAHTRYFGVFALNKILWKWYNNDASGKVAEVTAYKLEIKPEGGFMESEYLSVCTVLGLKTCRDLKKFHRPSSEDREFTTVPGENKSIEAALARLVGDSPKSTA